MALFEPGKQFPPQKDVKRIAKYIKGEKIFRNEDVQELFNRSKSILKNTPHSSQLQTLYTAVNLLDLLATKPADMITAEPPTFESGVSKDKEEQKALSRIVEENDLTQLIHEIVIGGGYRGDSWIKVHHSYRQDFSELLAFGGKIPQGVKPEPVIESVNPLYVFPEESDRNAKKFKAVNIAYIVFEDGAGNRIDYDPFTDEEANNDGEFVLLAGKQPYLIVERHIPNFIFYQKFRMSARTVEIVDNIQVPIFSIGEAVNSGRNARGQKDVVETGVPYPLVFHCPYKSTDTTWEGIGLTENIEDLMAAINDRITQISYILFKHADPTAYGPDLSGISGNAASWGGKYIPLEKDDVVPGYMTWAAQLESAFRELDNLLGLVFMMAETPQFLFGTTLTNDKAGSGTSHTDGSAIKSRYLSITTKCARIRMHMDKAIRDAVYAAQLLELKANSGVKGFEPYTPHYPVITWKDGVPVDEKEQAEIAAIRTNGKATLDALSAIKRLDGLNDTQAQEVINRINEESSVATPDIFNQVVAEKVEE